MDFDYSELMDAIINDLDRKARNRRNGPQGHWNGYCSSFSQAPGTYEGFRDDIRRRQRMAKACYEI